MTQKIALNIGADNRVIGYSTVLIQDGHILTDLNSIASDYTNYLYVDGQLVRSEIPDGFELRHDGAVLKNQKDTSFWVKDTGQPYIFGEKHGGYGWDGLGDAPDWLTEKAPASNVCDWSEKASDWVVNKARATELEQQQAQTVAAQKVEAMIAFVNQHLDTTAQSFGFDDIKSAALRASFTGSPLQPIGLALGVWMDEVWLICKNLLAQWQAGEIDEPTIETLQAALPPAPNQ